MQHNLELISKNHFFRVWEPGRKKKKKNSIRGYKMVDERVIDYSADGKDRPIPGHPCTYVAWQVFFF